MPNLADNGIKDCERHPLPVRFWFELSCGCLPWGFVQTRVMAGVPHSLRILLLFSFWEKQGFMESISPLRWCRGQGWDLDMTSTWCWGCQKLLLSLVSSYGNLWDDNWVSYQELHLCVTCPSALTGRGLWQWLPQDMKWWRHAPCPSINWLNWGSSDPVKLNITSLEAVLSKRDARKECWRGKEKYRWKTQNETPVHSLIWHFFPKYLSP